MDLREIVDDKPYFILTTNADEHLEAVGFEADRFWEIEGTFRQFSEGKTPENKQLELNDFLNMYGNRNLVILELGIGSVLAAYFATRPTKPVFHPTGSLFQPMEKP